MISLKETLLVVRKDIQEWYAYEPFRFMQNQSGPRHTRYMWDPYGGNSHFARHPVSRLADKIYTDLALPLTAATGLLGGAAISYSQWGTSGIEKAFAITAGVSTTIILPLFAYPATRAVEEIGVYLFDAIQEASAKKHADNYSAVKQNHSSVETEEKINSFPSPRPPLRLTDGGPK